MIFGLENICSYRYTANKGSTIRSLLLILPCQFLQEGDTYQPGALTLLDMSPFQYFEDLSPSIDAAVRLQPKCSERAESGNGDVLTTRMLVSSSRIGCLIGKGGSIVTEMRRSTRANIRILSKDNLPKVATLDDEMVQVSCCFCSFFSQVTLFCCIWN